MNRAGLNGLCVAAGVCLLYMLFDPDMISWRERGPGRGQPENAPWPDSTPVPHPAPASLPRTGGRPPARLWPAQVQPPSAPAFSPGPPPPGPDLPRGAPLGSEEGLGCWQGGPGAPFLLTVSPRTLGGSRPLPAHRHTAPSWLRPLVFGWVLGSHGSTLMALLSAAPRGPPPARGQSARRQSQQSLAGDSDCGRAADRTVQLSLRPGRSPPRSTLLGLLPGRSRAPRPHQEGRELQSADPTCSSSLCPLSSLQPDGFPKNANSITSLL